MKRDHELSSLRPQGHQTVGAGLNKRAWFAVAERSSNIRGREVAPQRSGEPVGYHATLGIDQHDEETLPLERFHCQLERGLPGLQPLVFDRRDWQDPVAEDDAQGLGFLYGLFFDRTRHVVERA